VWLEGVGGVGVTGRDVVPAVEVGVGWTFATDAFEVGPSLRYLRVVSRDDMATLGTAELLLAGVDIQFGRRRMRPPLPTERRAIVTIPAPAPVIVAATPPPPAQRDGDVARDRDTSCADVTDDGSCRLSDDLVLTNDRIVLDERVLFDVNRAKIRSRGRAVVNDLVRIWRQHPEWTTIVVEGHADVRGSDDYNRDLSQRRADRVRDLMIARGADPAKLTAIGHGSARPRVHGRDEAAHERNRRVEFVIGGAGATPAPPAPGEAEAWSRALDRGVRR
jgi:outer membrane protein OmpA-like peptidoglycan-associated protein